MTARCITPRRRSRPLALPATPIIAERFALPPPATPNCTQCHGSLETRGNSAGFARNIGSFESNHPEFAALRPDRRDPGTIQLNHYVHLQPNLLGPNGSRVQMVCADCHRSAADGGSPWPYGDSKSQAGAAKTLSANGPQNESSVPALSRAYMAPATYAQTCAACHSLQFDKRLADAVPHDKPEVIHTFVIAKLQAYIAANPADLRVPRDPSRDLPEKPILADYRLLTPAQWVAERTAEDEQLLWRKTCKQCHTLTIGRGRPAAQNCAVEYHGALYASRQIRSLAARPGRLRELPCRRDNQPAKFRSAFAGHRDVPLVPPRRPRSGRIALLRVPHLPRSRATQTRAQQFFRGGVATPRTLKHCA